MRGITITTIAVNKNEIACDLQATHQSGFKFRVKSKVFRFENPLFYPKPFYVGYAGDLDQVAELLPYLENTDIAAKRPKVKSVEFVVLTEDKKIYTFIDPHKWILVDEPYYAIGSGMCFAMGAFKMGATPKEAVQAASKCDPNSGLGVKVFSF